MELGFRVQRPVCYRNMSQDKTSLKIKPFIASFNHARTTHIASLTSWRSTVHLAGGISFMITARSDFSRRQQRKRWTRRSRGPPKGFTPRTPSGTSTQKRELKNEKEKEGSLNPTSSESTESNKTTFEIETESDEGKLIELPQKELYDDKSEVSSAENYQLMGNGKLGVGHKDSTADEVVLEGKQEGSIENDGVVKSEGSSTVDKTKEDASLELKLEMEEKMTEEELKSFAEEKLQEEENERLDKEKLEMEENLEKEEFVRLSEAKLQQEENERLAKEKLQQEENERLAKEKLQQEENERLAKEKLGREEIERLAEEKFSSANRLFVYPQAVKPDEDIEVFYNRSLSPLNHEPDVLMKGAFNDWKWRSFTVRLCKSQLAGEWWSCHLHIPKEAYKMDFVFFNGQNLYDNNENKDFCMPIEGGMDAFSFEDFLREEKRREQEQLAKEQAERERQDEEQRRIEAEKAADEADIAQAKAETEKRRQMFQQLIKKAQRSVDGVWYVTPSDFKGGDLIRLHYYKNSGPLAHVNELWIHGGYNSWRDGLSFSGRFVRPENTDGDWWYTNAIVPKEAFVLNWVVADGPPHGASVYDNNKQQDFHAIVPKNVPDDSFWAEEEQRLYEKLREDRRLHEEAMRLKAEETARMKAETKERTVRRFLLSQKHVVYTEPLDVQAGSTATVVYNPANTVLNYKPEIWFRYSFNRWTHSNDSSLQKMLPAENGPHVKATVDVPPDAYLMDFVFSEREDGGVFDNKDGMDYHLPVFGGTATEPSMHIVHIAVEMAPIAKVGGLGDVVTSLSRAVQDLNHNVDIVLPKYDCLNVNHVKNLQYQRSYPWGGVEIKVWSGKVEGLSVYFLEPQNGMFCTGCVYGCQNDGERFDFFCHAALEFLQQSGFRPDIIHCHDWSSAPVAWLYKERYSNYGHNKASVVFTIHNLEFGAAHIGKAMAYSDKATTVSPTYAREVAGNPAVAPHLHKFHGILNGIDPDIWDPYNDEFLPVHYTSENVVEGKRAAKQALQQRLGLRHTTDLPVVGIITRLTHQKGIHLITHAIWRTLERGGQVVLLGSAPDPRIQNDFVNLANQLHSAHNDRARLVLTYDEPLSHLIYAGSDFILVPSIFEPCGLTQLTAMRYGSIPVVRKTGGLYDTVFDVDHDKERAEAEGVEPNGFSFDGADAAGVDYALNRAISAFYDMREWFDSLRKKAMEQDWSWNKPALDYMELYHAAARKVR